MRARQFILSKIDALTSAASSARSDAMAEEGQFNYDISDVNVEARAAPKTGSGWFGWVFLAARRRVVESSIFPMRVRGGGSAKYTPPTRS